MKNIALLTRHNYVVRILLKFKLAIVVSLLTAFLLAPEWERLYVFFHTLIEVFCVTIALSTFLVIWYVSKIRQTNLILGFGFLAVAFFDIYHIVFWQGLGLFPEGYYDLSARYWVAGRFFEALFLILSTSSISKLKISPYIGLAITVFLSFSVGLVFYYYPGIFPLLLTPEGLTPIKILMEYIIIFMFLWFLIRVYKGYFKEDVVTKEYLFLAVLLTVSAELCFTLFTTTTSFYNVLGHVLKAFYYCFFLKAIFAGFVMFPHRMLQASEERFHKAFLNGPVSKSIISKKDCRFIDVNDNWLKITGYCREEVIGKTVPELNIFSGEVIEILQGDAVYKAIPANQKYFFQTKQGLQRVGLLSAQIIELQGQHCMLVAVMDITNQVRNEKEIQRLDKLNLIGQMAAGIGHEVRNPMTTVRGFLQVLGEKEERQKYKEYYNLMIEELDRANSIISDFLSLARNKTANLQAENLNNIVDGLYNLLQADALNADKNILLEKSPIADVKIDRNEIHQLILNLVRNGLEAMKRGGQVTIQTFNDGEEAVLAIKDEGNGIDPKILDNMGTPFLTTKEQGTGLGLATCYSIAERNNARIEVDTSSSGTTFFVKFRMTA